MKYDYLRGNNSGCPCKECGKREIGCHGQCGEYREWRAQHDERREARFKERKQKDTVSEAAVRWMWRNARWNRQQPVRRLDHER